MAFWILAALISIPLIEIVLFIKIGGLIGLWPTIAIVLATAIAGTTLLRQQGLAVLSRAQQELDQQRLPLQEMFSGACLVVAGLLLLTPGFFTDALGFALLIPPVRGLVGKFILRALQQAPNIRFSAVSTQSRPQPPGAGPIVDVEAVEVDEPADSHRNKLR